MLFRGTGGARRVPGDPDCAAGAERSGPVAATVIGLFLEPQSPRLGERMQVPKRNSVGSMTIQELEAEALRLPDGDRRRLAERLLASLTARAGTVQEDPILGLGSTPVCVGVDDGSVEHDRYLNES